MREDFRDLISRKLAAKQNQLGRTENDIKKLVPNPIDKLGSSSANLAGKANNNLSRFQNRLGPATTNNSNKREPLGSRLGPKVQPDDNDTHHRGGGDGGGGGGGGGIVRGGVAMGGVVQSRVVLEVKSRDEVLAEKRATENKTDVQRNRRMFGNLLGTLQRFRQDESRVKDRELKKRQVEKKIEEKTEKEKEEARNQKRQLFGERRRQQHELKILQLQLKRVEEFEIWENSKKKEMLFIRCKSSGRNPPIYYLPKVHSEKTLNLLEETMEMVEHEIADTRAKFEEDLLKIEAKMEDPNQDPEEEEEEDEDDEENLKPRSVVIKSSSVKKPPSSTNVEPPPHRRKRPADSDSKSKSPSRSQSRNSNSRDFPPAEKVVKVEREVKIKKEKNVAESVSSKKKKKQSETESDAENDSTSDSSSEEEDYDEKKKIKKEKD